MSHKQDEKRCSTSFFLVVIGFLGNLNSISTLAFRFQFSHKQKHLTRTTLARQQMFLVYILVNSQYLVSVARPCIAVGTLLSSQTVVLCE